MSGDTQEAERDPREWPPRWYRSRPEVLTYEMILQIVRQNAVLETKLDDARGDIANLTKKVESLELSRAQNRGSIDLGKWVANAVWALGLAIIGTGVWTR
jgi:hypothetical protein